MITNRRTFTAKSSNEEVVKVIKKGGTFVADMPAYRVYESLIGEGNRVVLEIDFQDLALYERFWDEWGTTPGAAELLERFGQLTESAWTNEIWRLC